MVLAPSESLMGKGVPIVLKLVERTGKVRHIDTRDYGKFMDELPATDVITSYTRTVPIFLVRAASELTYVEVPEPVMRVRADGMIKVDYEATLGRAYETNRRMKEEIDRLRAEGDFPLKGVVLGGGHLSESRRRFREDVPGIEVRNMRGTVDHGLITYPCSEGRSHVAPYQRVTADESGAAWVTPTNLKAWCDVNGETGDLVTLDHDCSCGIPSPAIEVVGRVKFSQGEAMKHLPAYVAENIAALISQQRPDAFSGVFDVRYEPGAALDCDKITFVFDTYGEPEAALLSKTQAKLERYATDGYSEGRAEIVPASPPMKAFLSEGSEAGFKTLELDVRLEPLAPDRRETELAKHKFKPTV